MYVYILYTHTHTHTRASEARELCLSRACTPSQAYKLRTPTNIPSKLLPPDPLAN